MNIYFWSRLLYYRSRCLSCNWLSVSLSL